MRQGTHQQGKRKKIPFFPTILLLWSLFLIFSCYPQLQKSRRNPQRCSFIQKLSLSLFFLFTSKLLLSSPSLMTMHCLFFAQFLPHACSPQLHSCRGRVEQTSLGRGFRLFLTAVPVMRRRLSHQQKKKKKFTAKSNL